jgi:hypothetical protein
VATIKKGDIHHHEHYNEERVRLVSRSGMSAAALVTLASAMALALVVLALSATRAQSTERMALLYPSDGRKDPAGARQ